MFLRSKDLCSLVDSTESKLQYSSKLHHHESDSPQTGRVSEHQEGITSYTIKKDEMAETREPPPQLPRQ